MKKNSLQITSHKITCSAVCVCLTTILLTGCSSILPGGQSKEKAAELTSFRSELDIFTQQLTAGNDGMNGIDFTTDAATSALLGQVDILKNAYDGFAQLDFPEEYDYLEPLADEAAEYMSTAADSFHDTFENDSYNQELVQVHYDYAMENYSRAYKRVGIIYSLLNGQEVEGVTLTTE